jgi:general stress protein 26
MTTPRTELDARFSDPVAQPTSWEDTLEAIEQAEIFWISTVRADGRPHVTPLVAVWLDDALHFSTGVDEQKARNLASNPRVALTTGANDWQSGLDVVVEGEAARVTDAQQLDRLAAAWAQKWDGRWQYEVSQDGFRHDAGTARVRCPPSESPCLHQGRLQPYPTSLPRSRRHIGRRPDRRRP